MTVAEPKQMWGGGFLAHQNAYEQSKAAQSEGGGQARRLGGIRGRILTTATELFERQTVARTYVADIMRAENFTRELFYYYFANKESLVESVVETYRERCFECVAAAVAGGASSDEELLHAVVDAAINLFYDEECGHSAMSRVLDELGLFRETVSETARYAAMCALGADADPERLRRLSVLLLASIGLAEVSDPNREVALGQAHRLISHALSMRK